MILDISPRVVDSAITTLPAGTDYSPATPPVSHIQIADLLLKDHWVLQSRGETLLFVGYAPGHRQMAVLKTTPSPVRSTRVIDSEINALLRVRHPNVIRMLECGCKAGFPYLLLPYKCRGDLTRAIPPGGLPISEAISIGLDVARGMLATHRQRLLHRDIKSANVLLGDDGAMLADYGLAIEMDRSGVCPEIEVRGTPYAMSPEQITPESLGVTAASDCWSFGILLYECLASRPPFGDLPLSDLWKAIRTKRVERLGWRVPRPLRRLVAECLCKSAGDRPDAEEIINCLQRLA